MVSCKKFLLFSTLLWTVVCTVLSDPPAAETSLGKIVGRKMKLQDCELEEYLGIPYAKPPIGRLRFRKPVPLTRYNRTIIANELPPACVQFSYGQYPWNFKGLSDEDCLYLNIWAPARSKLSSPRNKTVMFWMHGGGFMLGTIRQPLYNSSALACSGDVIIVTANYRLGAFGFMSSGTDDAPGNMGILDLLEALKWVNKNIEAFGGNPEEITIFGESAGSIIASFFAVSPLTKGLYKRIIMESGSTMVPLIDVSKAVNLVTTQRLAKSLKCANEINSVVLNPEGVVNCLRKVDAKKIAVATADIFPDTTILFLPQFGDELLPENPRVQVSLLKFHDSEILIGNQKDEGSLFLTTIFPDLFGFHGKKETIVNNDALVDALKAVLKGANIENVDTVLGKLLDTDNDNNLDYRQYIYMVIGDIIMHCPTLFFAEKFAEKGNNVYYYFFSHRPSPTPWADWMGVAHYEEVQFVFGNPILYPDNYTQSERPLSEQMMTIWTNFAKTGHPGVSWPLFSRENPTFRILNTSSPYKEDFGNGIHEITCGIFRPIFTLPLL